MLNGWREVGEVSTLGEIFNPLLLNRFLKLLRRLPGLLGFVKSGGDPTSSPELLFLRLKESRLGGVVELVRKRRKRILLGTEDEAGAVKGLLWNDEIIYYNSISAVLHVPTCRFQKLSLFARYCLVH